MFKSGNFIFSYFNKYVALLLALSILSSSIHADELLKLPQLVEHFNEHCKKSSNENISLFLYNHYVLIEDEATDSDKEEDASLPFKSDNSLMAHISYFHMCNSVLMYNKGNSIIIISHLQRSMISNFFADIWNPPDPLV